MKKWRRSIRYAVAFVMCLMITTVVILASLTTTITQSSFVKLLGSSNYYQNVKIAIIEQLNDIAIPSGLPQGFFSDINIEIDVYEDVNEQIKTAFTGSNAEPNVISVSEILTKKIENYILSQGQQIDFATEIEISSIVKDCVNEYQKQIKIPHLQQVVEIWKKAVKYIKIAILVLALATIAGCVVIALCKKWGSHKVSYMSYAFLGAGITGTIISVVTRHIGLYEKINIRPMHIRNFVVKIVNDVFSNVSTFASVAFLVGVVLATLSLSFGKKEIRHRRSKNETSKKAN